MIMNLVAISVIAGFKDSVFAESADFYLPTRKNLALGKLANSWNRERDSWTALSVVFVLKIIPVVHF